MKLKKTKKSVRQRGGSTHGHGARKKWKGSGHRGGIGMAGTGKRADQKKTLITAKYGNKYFGKQGITSKKVGKKKVNVINVGRIDGDYDKLMEKYGREGVLDLSKFKVLGNGEINRKVKVRVKEISEGARGKIEGAGGEVIGGEREVEVNDSDSEEETVDEVIEEIGSEEDN